MEYKQSVSNPMLIGALELMNAEPTEEHNKMVSRELVKAEFLSPASVIPPPPEGSTQLIKGCKISLPVLTSPDGKQFFMAFTDTTEFKKWPEGEGSQTVSMTFDDYVMMMYRTEQQGNIPGVDGFIVNPFGVRLVVPKELAKQFIMAKLSQGRGVPNPSDTKK